MLLTGRLLRTEYITVLSLGVYQGITFHYFKLTTHLHVESLETLGLMSMTIKILKKLEIV